MVTAFWVLLMFPRRRRSLLRLSLLVRLCLWHSSTQSQWSIPRLRHPTPMHTMMWSSSLWTCWKCSRVTWMISPLTRFRCSCTHPCLTHLLIRFILWRWWALSHGPTLTSCFSMVPLLLLASLRLPSLSSMLGLVLRSSTVKCSSTRCTPSSLVGLTRWSAIPASDLPPQMYD